MRGMARSMFRGCRVPAGRARLLAPMRKAGAELSARLHFHEVAPPEGDGPRLIRPINREEPMRLF